MGKFTEAYNADLANGLGNLVARVAKLCEKSNFSLDVNKKSGIGVFYPEVISLISNYKFNEALLEVWKKISAIDGDINRQTPWKLKGQALSDSLNSYVNGIIRIACNFAPFMPGTAETILAQFTAKPIVAGKSLFPRIS